MLEERGGRKLGDVALGEDVAEFSLGRISQLDGGKWVLVSTLRDYSHRGR